MIDNEYIKFVDATLQADGTYLLSGLLRGLWGTSESITTHGAKNERFVFLGNEFSPTGASFVPMTLADISRDFDHKAVTGGFNIETADTVSHTLSLYTCRPLPVVNIEWQRDGSGNIVVTWDRLPRPRFRVFSGEVPPRMESDEVYEVEVYAFSDPSRTITTPDGLRSVTYTNDMQIADGTDADSTSSMTIRRESTKTANSKPRTVVVNGGGTGPGTGTAE
jgi:hypothetical protein